MPNRLADESSPYLISHAHNPVDWYPWGAEALARAVSEDRPIFLSIGYSACHWCHVMERESFENASIAAMLNTDFVPIKVDREERPDLDHIYMSAVQIMTGRGGWPMSVFLTPDGRPFYGGTYWPPSARHGMPGFDQVLTAVADAWRERRPQALEQAGDLTDHMRHVAAPPVGQGTLSPRLLTAAAEALARSFDAEHGGFGRAPKFPHPVDLELLLHVWRRQHDDKLLKIVTLTLDRMAGGGMYDQLGGGFHRYSVDERWLVPHFEKMLYDNALLTGTYVAGYLATGNPFYAQVARETCDYVLGEMTDPAGGFYSTQDADSEGEEGKFFVWKPAELVAVLGDEAARTFAAVYDVTAAGNFEGSNILHRDESLATWAGRLGRDLPGLTAELAASRQKLLSARQGRVPPARDDKVLVAWNGLMIEALCSAATGLGEPRYLEAARRAADFLLTVMRQDDGRLLHSWRGGHAKLPAYLDDYAALAAALAALYQASFDERYLEAACQLADVMLAHFRDPQDGGFFYTADDHPPLIARTQDLYDGVTPSGNALAATALVRLAKLTGRDDYLAAAEASFQRALAILQQSPTASSQMLLALDFYLGPTPEIVIVADPMAAETANLLADLHRRFWPNKVVALRSDPAAGSPRLEALFAGKERSAEGPATYLCQDFACQAPAVGVDAAQTLFDGWQQTGG
ncbi:MAG TPA: thioredoxin domain-containing protein [Pirellulales bacterium]|jgi:hypothetical protein|nr:thioredoxin domain-containing protein [Pirellulales bacterium]